MPELVLNRAVVTLPEAPSGKYRWVAAFVLALVLHLALVLIPLGKKIANAPVVQDLLVEVEIMTAPRPEPEQPQQAVALPDTVEPVPDVQGVEVPTARVPVVESSPPEPTVLNDAEPVGLLFDVNKRRRLVERIMAEPHTDDDLTDPFGTAVTTTDPSVDFRFPERQSMITMLSPPLPEVPFADPGLPVFMYAPGFKGELHRGFDLLTPEFGWTSKTGFKIRCRFVLVLAACGWGR